MSAGPGCQPTHEGQRWQIELPGSEIARIEQSGRSLVVVLSAARVGGDRRQLDPALSGGHLQGVRWHLLEASWTGEPSALMGRIDEAEWGKGSARATPGPMMLSAPSSGGEVVRLALRTAMGDTLEVRAQGWRVELIGGGRFSPSMAC